MHRDALIETTHMTVANSHVGSVVDKDSVPVSRPYHPESGTIQGHVVGNDPDPPVMVLTQSRVHTDI